jgi:(1->4)-alpha-D-glucan 1-alpha-D-glucosylmutase
LLAEQPRNAFLADLASFAGRVAAFGIWNSLSQTLLKLTCPGVPDIYQGTELWTLSLVDPDNRRPVDYALPVALLHSIEDRTRSAAANLPAFVRELVQQASDGRIKLYVIWRALQQRKLRPQVFTTGAYVPLGAVGEKKEHLCAFARRDGQQALVVVVPRLVVALTGGAAVPPLGEVWGDTHLPLPDDFSHAAARNLLTGETHAIRAGELGGGIRLADLLRHFPVALLELS